jgi:hypothetical protein
MMNNHVFRTPRDEQIAQAMIAEVKAFDSISAKIKYLSSRLIGLPYLVNPLIGSLHVPEQLVARFDGFDCVTYVETILALSLARGLDQFADRLREIRYLDGEVEWSHRLHYTTDWAAYHIGRGFLRDMTIGEDTVVRERTLSLIQGLPPKNISLRYYPKDRYPSMSRWLTDGDLVYFLSTRRDLDIFHVGLIFRDGEQLLIRHARHMRHRVLEQPLADFMRVVKSPGFMINRLAKV